jgi:hypothetical protein
MTVFAAASIAKAGLSTPLNDCLMLNFRS